MRKYLLIVSALLVLGIGIVLGRAFWPLPAVVIVVGKDTTYFTEPLNSDGTVNYVAAYNHLIGAEADQTDNMAMPIIAALGPKALADDVRDKAAAALGLKFSDTDPCFIQLDELLIARSAKYADLIPPDNEQAEKAAQGQHAAQVIEKALGELFGPKTPLQKLAEAQVDSATTQPWSPHELPIVIDWLAANEDVLNRIAALERHSKFIIPMISSSNPPEFQIAPTLNADLFWDLSKALTCRAMLRLGQDDIAGAWDDALLMCYLGRLFTGSGGRDSYVSGLTLRAAGAHVVSLIAQRGDLSSAQLAEMLTAYDALPPAGGYVQTNSLIARLTSLDFIVQLSRHQKTPQSLGVNTRLSASISFDWNDAMRRINAVYDDIDSVILNPDPHQRLKAAYEVSAANTQLLLSLREQTDLDSTMDKTALLLSSSWAKLKFANDALVHVLLGLMMPDATFVQLDVQADMRDDLGKIALALAAYRANHGQYPSRLAELSPEYLAVLPVDAFNGDSLHYGCDGDSYRVWSVGRDLSDDGGDEKTDSVLSTSD